MSHDHNRVLLLGFIHNKGKIKNVEVSVLISKTNDKSCEKSASFFGERKNCHVSV